MNIEQFEILLKMIEAMSGNATMVFIWWVVLQLMLKLFAGAVTVSIWWLIYKLGSKVVSATFDSCLADSEGAASTRTLREFRDVIHPGGYGCVEPSEIIALRKTLESAATLEKDLETAEFKIKKMQAKITTLEARKND